MTETPHELHPLHGCEDSFVEISASSPALTKAGSPCDKVGGQRAWSVIDPRCICCALHAILLLIHMLLLVVHEFQLEYHILQHFERSRFLQTHHHLTDIRHSEFLSVPQIFFPNTMPCALGVWYPAGLVNPVTPSSLQLLAVPNTDSNSAVWNWLGATQQTLWEQTEVKAAARDVFLATLYLGAIAVFHVPSSSLLTLVQVPYAQTRST